MKRQLSTISAITLLLILSGCGSSLIIENVDYAQPLESVLVPDSNNEVHDQRYALRFTISGILLREGVEGVQEIRLIRDQAGLYYLTAAGFSSVYQFTPEQGSLKLMNRIAIPGDVLQQPALNQRGSYIELVDTSNGRTFNLSEV